MLSSELDHESKPCSAPGSTKPWQELSVLIPSLGQGHRGARMGLDDGDAQLGLHSTGCLSQGGSRDTQGFFHCWLHHPIPMGPSVSPILTHVNSGRQGWHPNLSCGCNPGQITAEDFLSPEAQVGPACTFIPTYKVIKLKQLLLLSSCTK